MVAFNQLLGGFMINTSCLHKKLLYLLDWRVANVISEADEAPLDKWQNVVSLTLLLSRGMFNIFIYVHITEWLPIASNC